MESAIHFHIIQATIIWGLATANVAGTFAYSPASGALLDAGTAGHLTVEFTPTDADNYSVATKAVTIDVPTTSTGFYSSAA